MIRTSPDGGNWTPSEDLQDVYDLHGKKAAHPPEWLTMPDADDPPDLEFYSGNAFWYHDRAYMMVLNYAITHPRYPGGHDGHAAHVERCLRPQIGRAENQSPLLLWRQHDLRSHRRETLNWFWPHSGIGSVRRTVLPSHRASSEVRS